MLIRADPECAYAQYKILKPCFEGVFTSCTAESQLLYVQLVRNSLFIIY